jgi:colanic acid biosynthesis glycosyl transferase WcaI
MHLIIHTQYYPPEIGAPQTRLHELAMFLVQQGIEITVLTAMPSYPRGRIYEGYSGWLQHEYLDGVRVIRTAIYPTQSTRLLPRLLSYFSFIFSSLLVGIWQIKQADFVLTESPPLFLGIAGFVLSGWLKARWIFNVSDLWPESVVELGLIGRDGLSYKMSSVLESFFYNKACVITCQSRTILENIQARFPGTHTYHLPNGVDTEFFQGQDDQLPAEYFQVVYAGLHGLAQGLDQILLAAQKLQSTEDIGFTFIGDGPEKQKLIQLCKDLGLKNTRFLAPISKEQIPQFLQNAQAIMVPLKIQLTGAVPSKLYEAMAMGKPVILIAESEAAQIVKESNCGIVVHPGDISGLVDAIRYLKDYPDESRKMGAKGRSAAIRNHDRKQITKNFAHFLKIEYGPVFQ